jgi:hypothetical protein
MIATVWTWAGREYAENRTRRLRFSAVQYCGKPQYAATHTPANLAICHRTHTSHAAPHSAW